MQLDVSWWAKNLLDVGFTSAGRFLELFKNRRFPFCTKPDRKKEPEPIRNLESKELSVPAASKL
jgi:hypothetical protein